MSSKFFQDGLKFPYGCWWNFSSICKGPFDLTNKMCLSCSTRLFWMNLFLLGKMIVLWKPSVKTNMALAGKSNSWSCISYQKWWIFQPAVLVFWSVTCSKHFWQLPSQAFVWEFLHIAQVILFSIAQNVHPKTTGGVTRQTRTFTHDWPWSRRRSRFFRQSKKVGSWFFGSIFWDDIILWSSSSLYIWQLLLPVVNTSGNDPTRFQINIGNWKMREYY